MDNRLHERTQMTLHTSPTGKTWGVIELERLAKPESVTVYLDGHLITPESFDIYGQPIISKEMALYFTWKRQMAMKTDSLITCEEVPATVRYEQDEISVPKSSFDSVAGIQRCLGSMEDFTRMLNNRKRYLKTQKQKGMSLSEFVNTNHLGEYVIWKRFILDKFASIFRIARDIDMEFIPDVCELSFFDSQVGSDSYPYGTAIIPDAGSVCPICGRKFSIYDMQTRSISLINEKHCHTACKEDYYKLQADTQESFS